MSVIADQLASQYPLDKGLSVSVFGLRQYLVKDGRTILLLLMGVVVMVLLIACANLAGLLVTRGIGRRNELAIRAALGASRFRLTRQLLVESLLLALIGGALGLLIGHWGTWLLLLISKNAISFGRLDEVRLDANVLGFTVALSALTALLFGLLPAWHVSRMDLQTVLKEHGRGSVGDRRHNRLRSGLVIGEVALAVVLLVGAGLLLRSFARLLQVNLGFQPEQALTMRLFLPYSEETQRADVVEQILQRVEVLPNVRAVGTIHFLPISGQNSGTGFYFEGQPEPEPSQSLSTEFSVVSRGYFAAMGIPLLQGRTFGPEDRRGGPRAAIINQSFLQKHFPQGNALGRRIVVMTTNKAPTEIVGVVGDIRHNGLTTEPQPTVFLLNAQTPRYIAHLVVRTTADPKVMAAAVRREVQKVDSTQTITAVKTMEEYVSESVTRPRLYAILLGVFAGLALVLAAIGLYGLMAYAVSQRTHEIGIRMALGAQKRDILRMVVGQGLILVLVGVTVGLAGAFALTRLMASLLYGVGVADPATFGAATLLLIGVALLACFIPARRATKVDPMAALRYE
jgi:putative ABC transport system permease protein